MGFAQDNMNSYTIYNVGCKDQYIAKVILLQNLHTKSVIKTCTVNRA